MTVTDPTPMTIAEAIAQVSAVLDNLRTVAADPRAAVEPDGTPGLVAPGELIESAWGNAVVGSIRRPPGTATLRAGGAGVDGAGSVWTDLIALGNVTVPAWATAAVGFAFVNAVTSVSATGPIYIARLAIGSLGGPLGAGRFDLPTVANGRVNSSWVDNITGIAGHAGTSQAARIQVNRVAGTGVIRADTGTVASAHIRFVA